MDVLSTIPRLKEISSSCSSNCDTLPQSINDDLTWIEGEQELSQCSGALWVSVVSRGLGPTYFKGSLVLSNFRLRFLPEDAKARSLTPRNKLLSRFDVVLYNIDAIYRVKKKKRKPLLPGCLLKEKVEKLEIVCKTFQTILLDLQLTNEDDNNCIIYLLIEALVTAQTESLMIYARHPDDGYVEESNLESYWSKILKKCNETSYRAVTCNESFHVTDSLPKTFVVPNSLSPRDVVAMATKFVNNRCPCWTYTHKATGAALIRMSNRMPGILNNIEEKVYNSIRSSHPYREYPRVFNLSSSLPSLLDIQSSYGLLQQLSVYDSTKDLETSDSKWYSQVEVSRWLELVSRCLNLAQEISIVLSSRRLSVVIREYSSTDLSPLVSSLVQVMLDEECRTIEGFQGMVRKEWLALGHSFGIKMQSKSFGVKNDSCPLFLLFLDCVHQLIDLKPSSFEFNSDYLVHLWHSVCEGLYRDLLFNSPKDLFYTTMKVQLDFDNGLTLLRRNNSNHTVSATLSKRRTTDFGIMGTLMRKSHLDFSSFKKHMSSLTNLSQSQSVICPNIGGPANCDSYSLKRNRSQLSKYSTLSINSKSLNTPSPNFRTSQSHLTPVSTCSSDWSESSVDLRGLKKSSFSQQRLNSSQVFEQDTTYGNPWTDIIGEISRVGSTTLWDWSFLYESSQMLSFKSVYYLANQMQYNPNKSGTQTTLNGKKRSRDSNENVPVTNSASKNFQKSALIIKGQKIYNYTSSVQEAASPSGFLKINFSVVGLTFWASCYLRTHPSFLGSCIRRSSNDSASCFPDEFDNSYAVYHQILLEIKDLEKCLLKEN